MLNLAWINWWLKGDENSTSDALGTAGRAVARLNGPTFRIAGELNPYQNWGTGRAFPAAAAPGPLSN